MITAVPLILSVLWTLIFFALIVGGVVCLAWAVVDAIRRPRGAFTAAGSLEDALGCAPCGLWSVDPVHRYDVGCCLPAQHPPKSQAADGLGQLTRFRWWTRPQADAPFNR